MRRRRNHRGASVLVGALIASTAAHLLVGPPLWRWVEGNLLAGQPGPPVRVVQLTAEQWSKNQQTRRVDARSPLRPTASAPGPAKPRPEAEQPPAPEPKPAEEKPTGQVVEVPPTADESPNPEAKLLAKHNAHVEKETVARMDARDPTLKNVTNKLERLGVNAPPTPVTPPPAKAKGDDLAEDQAPHPKEDRLVFKVPDILKQTPLDVGLGGAFGPGVQNRTGSEAVKGNSDHLEIQAGTGQGDSRGQTAGTKGESNGLANLPMMSALMPNLGTLARISGSPSMDHVEGLPEGDGTFLNTKEFKYATFFYRVRDSVYEHWIDAALREYRRRDPTGNIYGVRDRATLLTVELDRQGVLADIRVEKQSDVDFLDMVAVEAFRKAQPFPNPPPGIVDVDGRIRFQFQFVVTVGASSGFDLFRR